MEYRKFGNTDLTVSPICYGTMRYASKSGQMDDRAREGQRALEAAVDRGINFIHSSYEYGTRWLTSKVLADHPKRHDLHHIIKVNVPEWGEERFSAEVFRDQVEQALRELHTDRIAVVQHLQRGTLPREIGYNEEGEPARLREFSQVTEDLTEAFEKLKDEGKVGYLASFPYTVGFARQVIASGAFSGIVAYYNCLETEMQDLFADMQQQSMGFIGIRPFAGGLLTDRRVDRSKLPEGDRMLESDWDRLYAQLDEFRRQLKEEPEDWSEFAVRFSLADPFITSTVVGINTVNQLDTALAAVQKPRISEDVISAARELTRQFREQYGIIANTGGIPIFP